MEVKPVKNEINNKTYYWFSDGFEEYIPVACLAEVFDLHVDNAHKIVQRNYELFDGFRVNIKKDDVKSIPDMMQFAGKLRTISCLTLAGAFQFISLLDYKRYDEERREFIIKQRKWIVDTGANVIKQQKHISVPLCDTWEKQRGVSIECTKSLNSTLKEVLTPVYDPKPVPQKEYIDEAIMLNIKTTGKHEKGIRKSMSFEEQYMISGMTIVDMTTLEMGVTVREDREEILDRMKKRFVLPDGTGKKYLPKNKQATTLDKWF